MGNEIILQHAIPLSFLSLQSGAVQGSDPASAPSSDELITPDALMAYCESRLSSVDTQMQTIFQQQQASTKTISDIDDLASELNQYQSGIDYGTGSTPSAQVPFDSIAAQFNTAIQEAGGPNSDIGKQLVAAQALFNTGGDSKVSPDELSSVVKTLNQASTDVGSNAQLQMIQLQSLMSQQQTAIQLTTNLVQSMGDQANSVATNIGK